MKGHGHVSVLRGELLKEEGYPEYFLPEINRILEVDYNEKRCCVNFTFS